MMNMLTIKVLLILIAALASAVNCLSSFGSKHAEVSEDIHKGIFSSQRGTIFKSQKITSNDRTAEEEQTSVNSDEKHTKQESRHSNARNMNPLMGMIDPKRHPKPKKPMGNDIGVARVLDTSRDYVPTKFDSGLSRRPDHLEATVSIGIFMGGKNTTESKLSATESRELHDIMDSIPKASELSIANFKFPIDPEEEAINRRITEVARQLAENFTRKEHEEERLKFVIPLSTNSPPSSKNTRTSANMTKIIIPVQGSSQVDKSPPKTLQDNHKTFYPKPAPQKTGKSFIPSNALPLIGHLPQDAAQMQLLAEMPQLPHFLLHEGFPPVTPAPSLVGPLLGGPVLKDDPEEGRIGRARGKSLYFRNSQKFIRTEPTQQPNDLVASMSSGEIQGPKRKTLE